MSPRDLVYVGHMLDMARKAVTKTAGLSRKAYDGDENLRLALIHLIQIIGEAGRQVSREFSDRHPEIPWADIIGMRHKVVHDYLGVDEDIVWQVVTEDLMLDYAPSVVEKARDDFDERMTREVHHVLIRVESIDVSVETTSCGVNHHLQTACPE